MASNQQHPLHPAPPGGKSSGSGGGGIGRSAPIRTIGGGGGRGVGGPPGSSSASPSLPGGMQTPPLVKSKIALTPGRGASTAGASGAPPPGVAASATGQSARVGAPAATAAAGRGRVAYAATDHHTAYATGVPPLPPAPVAPAAPPAQQPQQQRLPQPPTYDPFAAPAPVTPGDPSPASGAGSDPIAMSRVTPGAGDPVVMARQSPGLAPVASETQPHIVSLPPAGQPAAFSHPLEGGAGAGGGGGSSPQKQQIQRPAGQQQQSYQAYSQPTQQSTNVHPLTQPPQQSTQAASAVQQQRQPSPTKQSSPSKQHRHTVSQPGSPDEEVDAFLRGDTQGKTKLGIGKGGSGAESRLRPPPLPQNQSVIEKAKTLASRRAWGDVIRVTNDALLGKDVGGGGAHTTFYNVLISAAAGNAVSTEKVDADVERLRRETAELISLRFISQLKLRRYVDLGKEVGQLGLMPHLPDRDAASATPPTPGTGSGGTSSVPASPDTLVTEASLDVLSSSPVKEARGRQSAAKQAEKSMAWKEGSIHSSSESDDKLPAWVPFSLRVLAAHQLQYNDSSSRAIDVLYDLRDRTVRTEYWNTQGMEIWRPAVDNSLVNAFVRKKEWRLALRSLEDLLESLEDGVDREVEWWCGQSTAGSVGDAERKAMRDLVTAAARVELLSRQLLVLLQSGAIGAAEAIQNDVRLNAIKVESLLESPAFPGMATLGRVTKELALARQVPLRQKVNEGLLQFARCNYTDAATYFRDALAEQRLWDPVIMSALKSHPAGCPGWKDLTSPTLGFDADPSLTVECLNNLSLCLLYSGNMRLAVHELEGLVREDPCGHLTEGLAFNLCTLYELGSDGEECSRKKKLLQRVAKRFYLHDVGVESFRLG